MPRIRSESQKTTVDRFLQNFVFVSEPKSVITLPMMPTLPSTFRLGALVPLPAVSWKHWPPVADTMRRSSVSGGSAGSGAAGSHSGEREGGSEASTNEGAGTKQTGKALPGIAQQQVRVLADGEVNGDLRGAHGRKKQGSKFQDKTSETP